MNNSLPPRNHKPILTVLVALLLALIGSTLVYIFFREQGEPLLPFGGGALPTTEDKIPPSQPTGIKTFTSSANIMLLWEASTDNIDVAGYRLYRDNSRIGSTPTLRFTDSAVTAETLYTYTISAYDDAGNESARSDVLSVRATDTFEPPTGPTLTVHTDTGESLSVKNFYNGAKEVLVYGDVLIQETEYYSFLFIRFDESFVVRLKDENVHLARTLAEQDVPALLGIPQAEACKLPLTIGVPHWVNERYSNEIYRLSFCPGAKEF